MEMKIDFDAASLQEATLRATLLKGVVDHLLGKLTPEVLTVFLEKTLADALKGISSYEITTAVRPHLKTIVDEYLTIPEVHARVVASVHQGVDLAVTQYPEEIRKSLVDTALANFKRALQEKLRC